MRGLEDGRVTAIVADERTWRDPALAAAAPRSERRAREDALAQFAEPDAGSLRDLRQQAGRGHPGERVDLEHELVTGVRYHHIDARRTSAVERDVRAQCL